MGQNQPHVGLVDHPCQLGVESQATDIVDDLHAELDGPLGRRGVVGIDGNRRINVVPQLPQDRHELPEFLIGAERP